MCVCASISIPYWISIENSFFFHRLDNSITLVFVDTHVDIFVSYTVQVFFPIYLFSAPSPFFWGWLCFLCCLQCGFLYIQWRIWVEFLQKVFNFQAIPLLHVAHFCYILGCSYFKSSIFQCSWHVSIWFFKNFINSILLVKITIGSCHSVHIVIPRLVCTWYFCQLSFLQSYFVTSIFRSTLFVCVFPTRIFFHRYLILLIVFPK